MNSQTIRALREEFEYTQQYVADVKWATKEEILDIYNNGKFEATGFFIEALNFDRNLNFPENK